MQKLDPKTDGRSVDIAAGNIEELKTLFPEVFTEGGIDFDALKETLGEYTEGREERYSFIWNGKSEARWFAQIPSTGTLRPCPEESVNWDTTQNLFIEGDNLEVLKLLQKSYYKKVKMIYIDPPYNTGKDFIYPDNFRDNIQNYLELTGQVDKEGRKLSTNAETSGRYHTDWLNMMYPRLKLARNLLHNDGVIFVSIGEVELPNLRLIMNEIYGEENYLTTISRVTKAGSSSGDQFSPAVDFIIVYAKDKDYCPNFIAPYSEEQKLRYNKKDENYEKWGPYMEKGLYQSSLKHSGSRYYIECPDGSKVIPPEGKVWRWNEEAYNKGLKDNKIVFKNVPNSPLLNENGSKADWNVYTKTYLYGSDDRGITPKNYINEFIDQKYNSKATKELSELEIPFDYPKPSELINYIASFILNKEGIILDFFAGSATTAHAIINLNKEDSRNCKFIVVQLPEPFDEDSEALKTGYKTIAEIGKERIRRVIKKFKEEDPDYEGDLGFKVFKLDSTNIKPWDVNFNNFERTLDDYISNIKDGRSEHDILYEILLKYGLELTLPIEERTVAGKTVFVIGYGALVICLADDITLETVEGIAGLKKELQPEIMRVVFKDTGFKGDVVKTNAVQILKLAGIEDVKSL